MLESRLSTVSDFNFCLHVLFYHFSVSSVYANQEREKNKVRNVHDELNDGSDVINKSFAIIFPFCLHVGAIEFKPTGMHGVRG